MQVKQWYFQIVFRNKELYGNNWNCPDGTYEFPGMSIRNLRTIVRTELA
jgi:hypothetical protein